MTTIVEFSGKKGRSGRRKGVVSSNGWIKDKLTTKDKIKLGVSATLLAGSLGVGVYYGHKIWKMKAPSTAPITQYSPIPKYNIQPQKFDVQEMMRETPAKIQQANQTLKNINNPNHIFELSSDITTIADFEKAPKKMTRAGAWTRIGTIGTLGGGLGAGGAKLATKAMGMNRRTSNIAALTAGILTGLMAGGSSYVEHRRNKYSPIGKKKWKNYNTNRPSIYGVPVQKLAIMKGLK